MSHWILRVCPVLGNRLPSITHQIFSRLVDKEKHEGFKQKRKGHYSNEAEAMRLAQALMAQETPEDEAGEQ